MGWNSWNHYGCNITENTVKETADALVESGLAAAGYIYVNIDDCWQERERNAEGLLQPNRSTFPSGIKALSDYVHSRGLKLGIYSDAGYHTCAGKAGSLGHETQDAQTFAAWGVDYLKYDNCEPGSLTRLPFERYKAMGDALASVGRKIVFSMCEWGQLYPAMWARRVAHADLWRTTSDINNTWHSMMTKASENNWWSGYAGPGAWNDPDMLEVGNGVLTPQEGRVHFSLWAIMKSPLLIGCDVTNMTDSAHSILTNKEAIAINQDPLGIQGRKVVNKPNFEVWAGPLSGNRQVVALVNKRLSTALISVDLLSTLQIPWAGNLFTVRDVWKAQTTIGKSRVLFQRVASHDVALLVLIPGIAFQYYA